MQCPACSAPLVSTEARCVSCHALVNPAAQGSSALAPRLVTPQGIKGPETPGESSLESLALETSGALPPSAPTRSTPDAEWRREVLERVRKRRQVRTHALPLFVDGGPLTPEAPGPAPEAPTPKVMTKPAAPPSIAMSPASLALDEEVVEEVAEVVEQADPRPAPPAPDLLASLDVEGEGSQDSVFDLPLRPVEQDVAASSPRARGTEVPTQSLVERPRPTLVAGAQGNRSLVADLPLVEPSRIEPPPAELPARRPASAVASRAASMNDRLQAAFIDVGMWSAMCVTAFYFASRIARTSILGLAPSWPGLLLFAVVLAAAYILFFGGLSGATPGKIACGIQVRRYDGSSLGPLPSLGRGFLGILGVAFLGVGVWPAFWDRDRRTLHDRATDSRVTTV
jgi:uncharacterized RDD family membrane protein YckC